MTARHLRLALALLFLLPWLAGSAETAQLDDRAWSEARKEARKYMGRPGHRPVKLKTIDALGRDDSRRACAILVQWTVRSLKLQQGPLAEELAERKKNFDRLTKQLLRAYEKMPPTQAEHKNSWDALRKLYQAAKTAYDIESAVRFALGEAFQRVRDAEAVTYLLEEGLPTVQRAKRSEAAQVAIARGLLRQPRERILETAIAWSDDAKRTKLRILALNWFGQNQVKEGFAPLVKALGAREVVVRRAAVAALRGLNDPRAVKPLIDALGKADGQLAADIDDVLHYFTGRSFEGSVAVWKRWWKNEGEAWLAEPTEERHHRRREELPGGTRVRFYGIPTESHHVVFVLDRSGSMKSKASDKSIEAKKKAKKPKPTVTGKRDGGKGSPGGRAHKDAIAGDTKMEVAKNQLALSVDELAKDVKFAVVFYSSDVRVWQEPPALMASTKANKKSAKAWFMKLGPEGSTQMFAALTKALEYADTVGEDKKKPRTGADTIFLLSDGSPTDADGQPLQGEELERQYRAFIEANQLHHCTVHTIGIGPGHNSSVLRRLAKDTGGVYKAVGTR
ncbi:MAG: vWA domain-containing protein [Planctomycetota bacterium]|nr:vWA domain-containing protein [Planctomycetota bacterium]